MNILHDLWYGNIDPQAREIKEGSPVKKALTLVGKNDEILQAMLSDTQKEQYDKLSDSQVRLTDLLEREAFAEGFCLAARLMIAVMNTMETPPSVG